MEKLADHILAGLLFFTSAFFYGVHQMNINMLLLVMSNMNSMAPIDNSYDWPSVALSLLFALAGLYMLLKESLKRQYIRVKERIKADWKDTPF